MQMHAVHIYRNFAKLSAISAKKQFQCLPQTTVATSEIKYGVKLIWCTWCKLLL